MSSFHFLSLEQLESSPFKPQFDSLIPSLHSPYTHFLLFSLSDELIGVACYNQYNSYIGNVIIKDSHRGNGYCKPMMKELMSRVKAKEYNLDVYCRNQIAVKCYKELGFKVVEKISSLEWEDYYVMKFS